MHIPDTTPHHSVYYDYQIYPFQTPPELRGETKPYPVVIVGAGPIGLVTALELARYGTPVVVISAEVQVSHGSRAIVFTRRSMEILQQVGISERMLEKAYPWRSGNSIYRGQRVFRLEAPYDEDDRFQPLNNLQQQYVEQYLVEQAAQNPAQAAAAADMLDRVRHFDLKPGFLSVPHPYKKFGVQAAAYRLGVPFTSHPMIGHDIIYTHPMNHCAAIGRAAQRDFLVFAQQVMNLDGGVYMSVGSAVMSPMIFEKSLSMSQNLHIQEGKHIDNHYMVIVDLQESHWDWSQGEPPMDNPDYYLRYNKSFNRMGGQMRYVTADNRDFLLTLVKTLEERK